MIHIYGLTIVLSYNKGKLLLDVEGIYSIQSLGPVLFQWIDTTCCIQGNMHIFLGSGWYSGWECDTQLIHTLLCLYLSCIFNLYVFLVHEWLMDAIISNICVLVYQKLPCDIFILYFVMTYFCHTCHAFS